jgi:hypothetical protein
MKEATGTAGIENQESLHLKILNPLGLSDGKVLSPLKVKALPFWCEFQPETVNSKWSQAKDFCVLLNSRHGVALENSWGQFASSHFQKFLKGCILQTVIDDW